MDLSAIMSVAKKNQQKVVNKSKIGYPTNIKLSQKHEPTVNPQAVKAFLKRKQEMEKMQKEEELKKKRSLQQLREEKKNTKKARAMATRTKDNLKIYRNDDNLGRKKEIALTPEEDIMHKAFMNKIMVKSHSSQSQRSSEEGERLKATKDELRKLERSQKRVKNASNLNFNDLINLAQQQKPYSSDDESSACSDSLDEELNAAERYQKERQKRKQLEAQLKAIKSMKRKADDQPQHVIKVPKLDKGFSDKSRQEKVKALLAKFNKKTEEKTAKSQTDRSLKEKPSLPQKQRNNTQASDIISKPKLKNGISRTEKTKILNHSSSKHKQIEKNEISKSQTKRNITKPANKFNSQVSKQADKITQHSSVTKKKALNPYAVAMAKEKLSSQSKCTLSVKNDGVRSNYPGVSQTDPKNPVYHKIKGPFSKLPTSSKFSRAPPSKQAVLAEVRRRSGHPGIPRRAQILDDDDDEYDSEMDDFIDDEDEGMDENISAQIGAIFNYNKSKYGRESEYELSKMDASFKDIEREEKRSLRIAQQEDAREAKLEEERRKKGKRR